MTNTAPTTSAFTTHTLESAPAAARPAMEAVARARGSLPVAVGRLAESPALLGGFLRLSAAFEQSTLEPLAREIVIMTVAARNGCGLCVQLHTARLRELGAANELVAAAQEMGPQEDQRLEAVRQFTLAVLASAGGVADGELRAFLDAGFTREQALEVVLGIGTYTMSTFANRLVRAPLLAS
ncbi:carboxymuconolactone decarboxylase family protein [Streptomyces sp. NA04227]|uniref:carboxymuconolactone decarboxylase family protein n=1 Tax=Streptomyces sp. NA04227 TaxID=2742136 RepID=UPI001590CA3C|nr:carboxymuconolactone decarboxylase family protein [Streptomyces sp. NA04227]QKW07213.1 carboxymuconolactone decarboxylase family protein [Streptomyces sp. NA04227]